MRHRMQIGTIVSDAMMKVKFMSGGYIGVIEEYFISRLEPGDVFTFGGQKPGTCNGKGYDCLCKKIEFKKIHCSKLDGWQNELTANLGMMLRKTFNKASAMVEDSTPDNRILILNLKV